LIRFGAIFSGSSKNVFRALCEVAKALFKFLEVIELAGYLRPSLNEKNIRRPA
jgi:hypothetical protein